MQFGGGEEVSHDSIHSTNEQGNSISYNIACAPTGDSDPPSLVLVPCGGGRTSPRTLP